MIKQSLLHHISRASYLFHAFSQRSRLRSVHKYGEYKCSYEPDVSAFSDNTILPYFLQLIYVILVIAIRRLAVYLRYTHIEPYNKIPIWYKPLFDSYCTIELRLEIYLKTIILFGCSDRVI